MKFHYDMLTYLKKNRKLQILFFILSMCIIFAIYIPWSSHIRNNVFEKKMLSLETMIDRDILFGFEKVDYSDDELVISGWTIRLNSSHTKVSLMLEKDENERHVIETELADDNEIENLFDSNWDFGDAKFSGTIPVSSIKKDACYAIHLILEYATASNDISTPMVVTTKKVDTSFYLHNGMLYRYNPETFVAPTFSDSFMQEVINEGEVYFYSHVDEFWIYEYQGALYWITAQHNQTDNNMKIYIPFHTYTSQRSVLPIRSQESGYENFDFWFEDNEIVASQYYRVSTSTLPQEYPITWIRTGIFDREANEWILMTYIPVMKQIEKDN